MCATRTYKPEKLISDYMSSGSGSWIPNNSTKYSLNILASVLIFSTRD